MTKRHYEAIAAILANSTPGPERDDIAKRLAEYFAANNPNFDRKLFLRACGVL